MQLTEWIARFVVITKTYTPSIIQGFFAFFLEILLDFVYQSSHSETLIILFERWK